MNVKILLMIVGGINTMVKNVNTRVTFTCSKKVAKFVKSCGGSKFINKCIQHYAYFDCDLPLEVWRDIFDEFNFID